MEYIKEVLHNYGIDHAAIHKLELFESRDGFLLPDENEFKEMLDYLNSFSIYRFLVPIMADGHSNYWCLYVDGPLKNMVCHLSHEEASLEPKFRNISSFIDTVNAHPDSQDYYDLEEHVFDLPNTEFSQQHQDKEIMEALYQVFVTKTDDDEVRTQTAFCIMALTSPSSIEETIYPFLDDEDMYIQERAIEILGFHRYEPAIGKLTELLTNAHYNGKLAAKVALQKIKGF